MHNFESAMGTYYAKCKTLKNASGMYYVKCKKMKNATVKYYVERKTLNECKTLKKRDGDVIRMQISDADCKYIPRVNYRFGHQ